MERGDIYGRRESSLALTGENDDGPAAGWRGYAGMQDVSPLRQKLDPYCQVMPVEEILHM